MIAEVIGGGAAIAGGFAFARHRRRSLYGVLAARVERIARADAFAFTCPVHGDPRFEDRIAVVPDFLPAQRFADLRDGALRLAGCERSFVPTHKKGGTVAYETLISLAPAAVAFYHSPSLANFVAGIVGERLAPTPIHDQSSLSVLVYDRPGDHIGWHFDHNFYRGRHFTLLLAIFNEGGRHDGLSHGTLTVRAGGREFDVPTPANTLVIFEGAKVRHKVSPIRHGERRIVLSMTLCADPRTRWWQGAARRAKDTAFYGIRALWT